LSRFFDEDLLTSTTQKLISRLHNHGEVCVVALYISKAFGQDWYAVLVAKWPCIVRLALEDVSLTESNIFFKSFVTGFDKINVGVSQGYLENGWIV
jgi:hypothetical protein